MITDFSLESLNFNSHAHVERDLYGMQHTLTTSRISTHTLTWSVTKHCQKHGFVSKISTHTLTWSVTEALEVWDDENEISTHTLTWSVTFPLRPCLVNGEISTHTLTWSVTCPRRLVRRGARFQLTRSRGA